jgi:anti-sigma-K factor RskA
LSRNIEKQEMRNYLLGTLEADHRTEFEERLLSDPDVYEELLVNEEELIDQYVAGSLSALEKQQFETHFLITAERQKNLRFGRLLDRYLHSRPALVHENVPVSVGQTEKIAPANRSFPLFLASFGRGPVLAVSAALVLCLGLTFCYWIVARRPAASAVQQNNSRVMVVTIAPGSTRSSGTTERVTVPPKGVDVKLELEIANQSFNKYKSELIRESESLDTQAELKMETRGDQHFVPLTIAGDMLSPGDYQVKLSGVLDSGQDEFIDNYSFRVITE